MKESGYIVAIVPGTGLAYKLPKKTLLAGLQVSGKVEFGLGGRASFNVGAQYEHKDSECGEEKCDRVTASAELNLDVDCLSFRPDRLL